ncbi:agmatine deiminase family protein [Coraliomargarita sinensis]|nr:agmatine deiminase family protein [Coraliomargarita sinensis]
MARLTTPKGLGYRLPAEWEPQEAVWFAWPSRDDLWPGRLERVKEQLAALYLLAAKYQTVRVLCAEADREHLLGLLDSSGEAKDIELYDYTTDDIWIRDFGPLFLINEDGSKLCIADWRYNAWGNKFPEQQKDDRASAWIADQLGLRRFIFDTVLEGGAIESNGDGQLMTTEAVLLNENRNGETSTHQMEQKLCSGLGVDSVLWFKDGLAGDDTDGHIDNLARFFKSDGILIADTTDSKNPNVDALQENITRLQNFRTPQGDPFASVQLPLPEVSGQNGEPLAASYLNYLVLNGAVLVPTYGQSELDQDALEIIGDCFPEREVVGFDCSDLIHEGGALHCMSQNQPKLR